MTSIDTALPGGLPVQVTAPVLRELQRHEQGEAAPEKLRAYGEPANVKDLNLAKMREVAQDFESVFLAEMIRPLFESVKLDSPFGGGQAEDIFSSMQVDEYAKALSKRGGVGIADQVLDQLIRMQEAA